MKITLAQHSGFCMGVRNAVLKIINELQDSDEEILVFGPLIHNPQTIELLETRGLKITGTLDGIEGKQIAIRSHGIPVGEYREIKSRAKRVINLTCPRVAKVQSIIKKYSSRGYFTIIIGDRDHAEVIGLMSYASGGCAVVSHAEDLAGIPDAGKYVVVAQTTADRQFFSEVIETVKKKYTDIEIIDTICNSTRHRQEDVLRGINDGIDTLVVVGGKNSANTKRLAGLGEKSGIRTILIETETEIVEGDFKHSNNVLITAGASTPGWIINAVVEKLHEIGSKKSSYILYSLLRAYEFIVKTNILSSMGAAAITAMGLALMGKPIDPVYPVISLLYIFSMNSVNNYLELQSLRVNNPYKFRIYRRYGTFFLAISILSIAGVFILARAHTLTAVVILSVSTLLGAVYSSKYFKLAVDRLGGRLVRRIYDSRIVSSLGWVVITAAYPAFGTGGDPRAATALGLFVFSLIFMRQILMDTVAYQGDLILGRETMAIVLGPRAAKYLLLSLSAVAAPPLIYLSLSGNPYYLLLLAPLVFNVILLPVINRPVHASPVKPELAVDTIFIIISGLLPLFF